MNQDINKNSLMLQYSIPLAIAVLVAMLMKNKKEKKYIKNANVSLKAKWLNLIAWPYWKFKLRKQFKPLSLEKLKKDAAKREGLDDFGEWNDKPFNDIIKLINENKNYTPVGRIFVYEYFAKKLSTKLRIRQALKDPEIDKYVTANPIRRPFFIVGIGRVGTTFLHRLLSLDPKSRSPYTWELTDPVPRILDDREKDKKKRVKYLEERLHFFHSLVPHFGESHNLKATNPEECMYGLSIDSPFMFECFRYTFRNSDLMFGWDLTPAYRNYAYLLQILEHYSTSPEEKKRWVLKAPAHLGFLPFLVEVFPDADIIWVHRDLKKVIPSAVKFLLPFWDIHETGPFDTQEIGFQVLKYMSTASQKADKFFNEAKDNALYSVTHVKYDDLIPDPIGTVKKIYEKLGYEFTDEYHNILANFIAKDKLERESEGVHNEAKKPKLEDYGLTVEDIDNYLGWYNEKFSLEM